MFSVHTLSCHVNPMGIALISYMFIEETDTYYSSETLGLHTLRSSGHELIRATMRAFWELEPTRLLSEEFKQEQSEFISPKSALETSLEI